MRSENRTPTKADTRDTADTASPNARKAGGLRIGLILVLATVLSPIGGALAQDLEPRAFSPVPVGMNFGLIGYGKAKGNVFFDQSLPVEDATGEIDNVTAGYLRTMSFFGATAKLGAVVPYAWGDYKGLWLDQPAEAKRQGFADPVMTFAVNFVGAPARTLKELASYKEGIVVGASLLATIPLGQYDPEKLINLGSNRWSFRGRLGGSQKLGRWNLELMAELWAFTQNPEALGGVTIDQDPILAVQFNAIYQFRRGFWMGAGLGYGEGGQTTVSGVEKETRQINKRIGATLVFPLNPRHSLKVTYLNSLSTLIGADFDRFGISWQMKWGGGI